MKEAPVIMTPRLCLRPVSQTPAEALHPDAAPPPPLSPNSERRPILSAMSGLFSLALVAALGGLAAVSLAIFFTMR